MRNLGKMRHTSKNAPHFEKCATLGKMRHTSKNVPRLAKCTTFRKMRHTWKNAPRLAKFTTLGKMRHTWKKYAKLGKMCHTWKTAPLLKKMLHTWKNAAQLIKWSFHRKPRPWRVTLECPGLKNIPQIAGNRPKVDRYHAALKTLLATFWVSKWSGAIFWTSKSKPSVQVFFLCPFHQNPRASRLSLESLGLENIPQVPKNRPEVGHYHIARKAGSATLLV